MLIWNRVSYLIFLLQETENWRNKKQETQTMDEISSKERKMVKGNYTRGSALLEKKNEKGQLDKNSEGTLTPRTQEKSKEGKQGQEA